MVCRRPQGWDQASPKCYWWFLILRLLLLVLTFPVHTPISQFRICLTPAGERSFFIKDPPSYFSTHTHAQINKNQNMSYPEAERLLQWFWKQSLKKIPKPNLDARGWWWLSYHWLCWQGDLGLVPSLTGQLIAVRSCSSRRPDMTPWHQAHTWGIDIHKGSMPTHINSF